MRRMLAATLLAAVSFTGSSYASQGCVTDFLIDDSPEPTPVLITRNPDGSITLHPPRLQLLGEVDEWADRTTTFVNCVV